MKFLSLTLLFIVAFVDRGSIFAEGCDAAAVFGPDVALYNKPGRPTTFENWGSRFGNYAPILFPQDEIKLQEIVVKANQNGCKVAVRGAGHSSSGIVMQKTETNVVAVHLADLVLSSAWSSTWSDQYFPGSDIYAPAPHKARIGAGKSLLELSSLTRPEGALLIAQPAAHIFSVGGVIANAVVGAKASDGSPAGFVYDHVTALLVMWWDGSIHEITEESITPFDPLNQDLTVWRGSLGLLGIIIAAEFELEQDFGWAPQPFHSNYYNFDNAADRIKFQTDQAAYNQNKFAQHFVGSTNPFNGETEIGTMTATMTGTPFAPNTDLGEPLNSINAAKKIEYQTLYSTLLGSPAFADMGYTGAGTLTTLFPGIWCALIPSPNLITEYLCNTCSDTAMPCSAVDCSTGFFDWPKAVRAYFENGPFSKLPSFGQRWNDQAALGNDGFWATTAFPAVHELATFVPMNSTQDMLDVLDAYFIVEKQTQSDAEAHFDDPVSNNPVYVRSNYLTWRYQTISGSTSNFSPLLDGSYAQIDMLDTELDHLDKGHVQRDWGRYFGDLEAAFNELGSMNHLGKEHGWATTPNWDEFNVQGQVLVEYQNEDMIEKTWSDPIPEVYNAPRHLILKTVASLIDPNSTFMRGYQKQLLRFPSSEVNIFELRNLVGFPCEDDWECISDNCNTTNSVNICAEPNVFN